MVHARFSSRTAGLFAFVSIAAISSLVACAEGSDVGAIAADAGSTNGDGGNGGPASASADGGEDAGPLVALPAVATASVDRVGIYDWGVNDSQFAASGAPDRLTWSASKVSALGATTIRVAMTPEDPYQVNPAGAFDLVATAKTPAYATLFANAAFKTILITAYTVDDQQGVWQNGYSSDAASSEQTAIAALAQYLLDTYPGKVFVIVNWEGDNAILPYTASSNAWAGFSAWANARADGVAAARSASSNSTSQVYSALEFNALRAADNTTPCGTGTTKCIVSDVAPYVRTDLYSYSSWQSLTSGLSATQVGPQLSSDLDSALAFVQKTRPNVEKDRFFVGELGAAREDVSASYGECNAAARMIAAANAATTWGARWAIDWQVIDNAPSASGPEILGFGLYKASGAASLSETLLAQLYAGAASPAIPTTTFCPTLNIGGVVNSTPGNAITVGSTVSLYGHFSAAQTDTVSGYQVHVRIGENETVVTKGSTYWYESYEQINATLSGSNMAPSTNALVWVTSPAGVDSNGQYISVTQ